MPAPKPQKKPEEPEDWLTTYADAITLLMAFFVMLLSFSEFDVPAYQEAAAAISNNIGMGEKDNISDTEQLKIDIEDTVFEMQADQAVDVKVDKKGVVIELAGSAFFQPGTAILSEQAVPVLEKITQTIQSPKFQYYNIEVGGHSDDSPIQTEIFPSNWELSAGRASTVVRFFAGREMSTERMKVIGFADTQPKVPNLDIEGNPIPENRAINRRITIRVFPISLAERARFGNKTDLKGILDAVSRKTGGEGTEAESQ